MSELRAQAELIVHSIRVRTAQIADRFIARLGDIDRCQFPCTVQACQLYRISLVGFYLVTRLTPGLCGSATDRLQPATPAHRTRRRVPGFWLVFPGDYGNTRDLPPHDLPAPRRFFSFVVLSF